MPSRAKGNQMYVPELDRIVLRDNVSKRAFANLSTGKKSVVTARILSLVHELCRKNIHVCARIVLLSALTSVLSTGRPAFLSKPTSKQHGSRSREHAGDQT